MRDVPSSAFAWLSASVLLVSVAQLSLKYAMQLWPLASNTELVSFLLPLGAGLSCYALSVGCWLVTLRHLPLNLAYPLLSLSYLLVYVSAVWLPVFNEVFSMRRFAGVVLLIVGIILVIWPSPGGSKSPAGSKGE